MTISICGIKETVPKRESGLFHPVKVFWGYIPGRGGACEAVAAKSCAVMGLISDSYGRTGIGHKDTQA